MCQRLSTSLLKLYRIHLYYHWMWLHYKNDVNCQRVNKFTWKSKELQCFRCPSLSFNVLEKVKQLIPGDKLIFKQMQNIKNKLLHREMNDSNNKISFIAGFLMRARINWTKQNQDINFIVQNENNTQVQSYHLQYHINAAQSY